MKTDKFDATIEKVVMEGAKQKAFNSFKEKFLSEMRGIASKL